MVATQIEVRKEFETFVENVMETSKEIQMLVELLQTGKHEDYIRVIRELPELVHELTCNSQDVYWTLVTEGEEYGETSGE